MNPQEAKLVVVGGGPAGMMAAIAAAERGCSVTLLEPNERLGKKLNITGKGRCNVTNRTDIDGLIHNTPRNGKFLYSAFNKFDSENTVSFFERLGVPLKTERGNRVFPVSDRAFDISGALEKQMKKLHVRWLRDRAVSFEMREGRIAVIRCTEHSFSPEAIVLATGGISYPATGSTGEGHELAKAIGHDITPLSGSLVPLCERGSDCSEMQGLSLRNISITVLENGKKVYSDFGEMLFTHFGVSGPVILSASAHMRYFGKKTYLIDIDLKPALDQQALDKRLLSDFKKYANSDFGNALVDLLPQKMIPVFIRRSGIDPHCKVHDITKEQRSAVLQLLKHFSIEIAGPRPVKDAIITTGGVSVKNVDPSTMESKIVPGLYFAGELLDCDAYTGGFNLQIAWSTGYLAGLSAAQRIMEEKE